MSRVKEEQVNEENKREKRRIKLRKRLNDKTRAGKLLK